MRYLKSFTHNFRRTQIHFFRGFKCQRGQSLIELSLVLPVLFAIVLGTTELARMGYAAIAVSNAATSGAIYGSQNLFTASDVTGMQRAAQNDAADIASWTDGGVTATAVQSCTCTDGTVITCSNAGTQCVSPARIEMYVQVNTAAKLDMLFYHFSNQPETYTVHGQAIMRVAQ